MKGQRHYIAADLADDIYGFDWWVRDMLEGLNRLLFIHRRYRWWSA